MPRSQVFLFSAYLVLLHIVSWYPFHSLPHKYLMFYFWKKSQTRNWQDEIQFTFQGKNEAIMEEKCTGILSVWNNKIKKEGQKKKRHDLLKEIQEM